MDGYHEYHGRGIKIFAANSNKVFAEALAKKLNTKVADSVVSEFADGETAVAIGETVRGYDVFVVQSTCKPVNRNLMELLLMIDAFKRASAATITAVIPYYGYARQDRKIRARDPISAKLVADLISTAGADRVLTMDLHAPQIQGFFNVPLDHLQGAPILLNYYQKKFKDMHDQVAIVAPDLGSVARTRKFAEKFDAPLAIIDKRRPKANVSEVMNIIGDVTGKTVILIDDMIDTAGTLCQAAEALVKIGKAKAVYAGATHAVLSKPSIERIAASVLEEVVVLDTIPLEEGDNIDKIVQLSAAGLFANAIDRIFLNEPVSPLFL